MIANPELERNLWIECVGLRLIAAVATPALIFLLVVNNNDWPRSLFIVAHFIILMAVAFWGARKAADAVASEMRDRTWDQQRLSGLGPAAMTIGKVFGAPSLVWVVIGVCVVAQIVALASGAGSDDQRVPALAYGDSIGWAAIVTELGGAFMVFSAAFFAGLLALNGQERQRAFDATLFQVAGVLSAVTVVTVLGLAQLLAIFLSARSASGDHRFNPAEPSFLGEVVWWGQSMSPAVAVAASLLIFGAWALYGGVHQMRRAFAMKTTAIGWIGFLLFLALYLAGLAPDYWALVAAVGVVVAVYAAALFEPHRLAVYRDWLRRLGGGDLMAIASGPAWLYAWLLATALALTAFARSDLDGLDLSPEMARYFSPQAAVIAAILFALRDVGVCVWAGLRASDGRGLWTAVLILVVLHFLLGPLLAIFGDASALQFTLPLNATSIASAALQAAIIWIIAARELSVPVRGPAPAAG